jgi:hypothetical protein
MYCPFRNLICIAPSGTLYVLPFQGTHMYCPFMNFICIAPSVTSYVLPLQEPHKLPFRNLYKIKALVKPTHTIYLMKLSKKLYSHRV